MARTRRGLELLVDELRIGRHMRCGSGKTDSQLLLYAAGFLVLDDANAIHESNELNNIVVGPSHCGQ